MRLVFAGTPAVAVPSLRALQASRHEITQVLTRRDAPRGRRRVLTPSEVAACAAEHGLSVLKADRLDHAVTATLKQHKPDLGVIVAYGGLVPEPLLSVPRHGWINLHFSLLPRWRGAAPVQHALIAGDRVTGVSVFQLVPALDAGDLLGVQRYQIPHDANAGDVLTELSDLGTEVLLNVVNDIEAGTVQPAPQLGEVTVAPKLTPEEGLLRFDQPAERVLARFRGVTPEPGAYFGVAGARVKVLQVQAASSHPRAASEDWAVPAPGVLRLSAGTVLVGTGTTPLVLDRVQPAGKRPMSAADWFRGLRHNEPVVAR